MFYTDLTVNEAFYESFEEVSRRTLKVFFIVGFSSIEATSRLEQSRVLMGSWHKAIGHFVVIDQAISVFIEFVKHDEHLVLSYSQVQVFGNGIIKVIAVDSVFASA